MTEWSRISTISEAGGRVCGKVASRRAAEHNTNHERVNDPCKEAAHAELAAVDR
jgi:hypothetical protein